MKSWKRFVVAAFVVFLYYSCEIISNELDAYRHQGRWPVQDIVAIFSGIALLAGLACAADAFVTWIASPLLRRVFNHVFMLAFVGGWLNLLGRACLPLVLVQFLYLATMVLIGFSLARPQWKLVHYTATICLCFSPAIPLVAAQMFLLCYSPDRLEFHLPTGPVAAEETQKTPVFFFVFDEWSFQRSCKNGKFRPELINISALAEHSVVFTQALSPANGTIQSLPRYIFQNDLTFSDHGGQLGFEEGDTFIPTQRTPSLFQLASEHGYKTYLLGWFHAYRFMLGKQVDYYHVFQCNQSPRHSFGNTFLWRLERNLFFFSDPISLQQQLKVEILNRQYFEMCVAFKEELLKLLACCAPNSFAFFHTTWPHFPFVLNPDGTFNDADDDISHIGNYQRSLQYLDTTIGQITDTLHAAGKYNDALLILTSDHGWRYDLDAEIRKDPLFDRRVPLIIKLPGEKTSYQIDKQFCANQLKPLIEAVFAGEKDPRKLLKLLPQEDSR